ncbi:MAG: hypothetical protein H0S78_11715 [Tissierellales bacterium]|jgi:hypothetical protein|nr:hypothetical protein [Tissierellales bacterium]HCX05040.1 hypothetical protein [Clostridiales bacterium]
MDTFRIKLNNQYESDILTEVLDDYKIPYALIKNHSVVYDGIFENQFGWGYLEIENKYKDQVEKIYDEFTKGESQE